MEEKVEEKVLILPDIHGRKFWKTALNRYPKEKYPNLRIVFLGDYLDPYTGYEDIMQDEAYENFKEIIECAKNDRRIILLMGNHDWHYIVPIDTCRIDRHRFKDIQKLIADNISLFSITYDTTINGKRYIFSHAGITSGWLNSICEIARSDIESWNSENIDEKYEWAYKLSILKDTYNFEILDDILKHYDDQYYARILSMISYDRGGYHLYGSVIWADVHEHIYKAPIQNIYQIFGHTISFPNNDQYAYSINDNWAMLDASQAFVLYDDGKIEKMKS